MGHKYLPKLQQLAQRVASQFHGVSITGIEYAGLLFYVHARINGQLSTLRIDEARVEDAFEGDDKAALERALAHDFILRGARRKDEE